MDLSKYFFKRPASWFYLRLRTWQSSEANSAGNSDVTYVGCHEDAENNYDVISNASSASMEPIDKSLTTHKTVITMAG